MRVTAAELYSAQAYLSDAAADLAAQRSAVDNEVGALLASWTGGAATAFGYGFGRWLAGFGDVLDGLGRTAALLADSAERYRAADIDAVMLLDGMGS